MYDRDDSAYHALRARVERETADRAAPSAAAEAHRRLSALHLDRLREIDEGCGGSRFGSR